jgi:hypothetical protein
MAVNVNVPYVTKLGGFALNSFSIIVGVGAPTAALKRAPGTFYLDQTAQVFYTSGGVVNNQGVWIQLGSSGGDVITINSLLPSSGNINIAGTSNQLSVANAGSTVTLSLPAAVTAPGSLATTTTLTAGTDLSATNGNITVSGSGKALRCKGGAVTDFIGEATLVGGTVTVANTNIAATDRIFLVVSNVNTSTKVGHPTYSINAGVGFTINSVEQNNPAIPQPQDVSTISYFIVRQI